MYTKFVYIRSSIMYDSIFLRLDKKDIGDSYKWYEVLKRIYQTCEYKAIPGGCGYFENLRISVTENRVVCVGSFAKFQNGNNIIPLTMRQVQRVIKTLTRVLGIPMYKADVIAVDIAGNFNMEKPPELYIQKLRSLHLHTSAYLNNTKYFLSREVKLCFYDKGKEIQQWGNSRLKRKGCLLLGGEEKNLLRYEARFKKGKFRKMFGRGLKAYDLYNKDVYWRFISEWLGCYDDMDKQPNSILDVTYEQIAKQKDMLNWCICALNTYIPLSEFIRQTFNHRKNPQDSDRQYHQRIQKKIREAFIHYQDYMTESDLVLELTKKIEDFLTTKFEESPDAYDKN